MNVQDKFRNKFRSRDALPPLRALPSEEVLLQRTREILSQSRPAAKRDSRVALAQNIVRTLTWIRRRTDEAIDSWDSYLDQTAWLRFQTQDVELPAEKRADLLRTLDALEKEQRSNRRNRLRWLRSQNQEAHRALESARRQAESLVDGDFPAWLVARSRQSLVRLRKGVSAKAWNAEATGIPTASTEEIVPALKPPETAGLPEALEYLQLYRGLPYETIRKLLGLYGLANATVGQLRVAVKRLRARISADL